MEAFKKWLEKNGIKYRSVEPWSLMFKGNHPEGVFIDIDGEDGEKLQGMIIKTVKRRGLHFEYRGHYTSLYISPATVQ